MRIPKDLNERYERLAEEGGRPRPFYFKEALDSAIDELSTNTEF